MRFDHIEEARAWAFECIQRRPVATPSMSNVQMMQYAQIGIESYLQYPAPASLERQIAEAEMLAQWVYAGRLPGKE